MLRLSHWINTLIISSACLVYSGVLLAASDGFYTGLQAGLADTHYSNVRAGLNNTTKISDNGLGKRAFFGYQFTPHWATEIGYTHYRENRFVTMNDTTQTGVLKQSSIELVGKYLWPFLQTWNAYGTLGVASLRTKTNVALAEQSTRLNARTHRAHLLWGAGLAHDITEHTALGVNWTHLRKRANVPDLDFYAATLAYHFG